MICVAGIYHYFARKEDIISNLFERTAERYMEREHAGLAMEILAESVRNPEIAKLIEESDTDVRRSFERLRGERTPETVSRCALVAALLDGLSVRSIRHPGVAGEIDRVMLAKVMRFILTA